MNNQNVRDSLSFVESFIERLKIKPKNIRVSASVDEMRGLTHALELTYEYKGKLRAFGEFLHDVAVDVSLAGCFVVGFGLPVGIRAANEPDKLPEPTGEWSTVAVTATVKTTQDMEDRSASFAAMVDYLRRKRRVD